MAASEAVDVFNFYFLKITEFFDLLEWFYESDKNIFGNIEKIMEKNCCASRKI